MNEVIPWCSRLLSPLQEGRHPNCNFLLEVERDHAECLGRLREEKEATSSRKGHVTPPNQASCSSLSSTLIPGELKMNEVADNEFPSPDVYLSLLSLLPSHCREEQRIYQLT